MRFLVKSSILVLLAFSSVTSISIIYSTNAQSDAPQFTVQFVDHSYDIPPKTTATTDPYTGKTATTTVPGYRVENKTIEATIRNPPDANYYNFRWKGHYENQWRYEPFNPNNGDNAYTLGYSESVPFQASTSAYTVLTLYFIKPNSITSNGEVDIQVQALYGNFSRVPSYSQPMHSGAVYDFVFNGTISDWSGTQTVKIPAYSGSPTSAIPELMPIIVLIFLAASLCFVVKLRQRIKRPAAYIHF